MNTVARSARIGFVLLALASGEAIGAEVPSPALSAKEFADLVAVLENAQDGVMARISGLTDEQWSFKQNPDRWSIGECVEHITRSEKAMLEKIRGLLATAPDPQWFEKTDGKLAILQRYVPDRRPQGQGGVRAPEELEPTETWSRRHGIEQFYATQGEVRSFIETMDRHIKDRTMESTVPIFGWLNGNDWLHSLTLHMVRHTGQIAEVQADPRYPAKAATPRGPQPDPRLTDEELTTLLKDLDEAQDFLLGRLTGLTDEQWSFKQNPDRWSIAECVEHIAVGERVILEGIAYAMSMPPNPNWYEQTKGKNEFIRQNTPNRTPGGVGSPFKAPYEVAPTQHWDRARGLQEFYRNHGALRAFVETMPREVKNRTFMNPFPQFGMLNVHDWLTLTAMHVQRHTKQIIEVQEDANYPGKAPTTGGR
jgi:uncharacterized damage-inducible protein DinB